MLGAPFSSIGKYAAIGWMEGRNFSDSKYSGKFSSEIIPNPSIAGGIIGSVLSVNSDSGGEHETVFKKRNKPKTNTMDLIFEV